ncbi:helix-turn-helix domain-containing protein [Actinosynnema sp. CS-041913]|uniref:helix-turn-helix domain-containing protein n=1 Tax=Actinosynnema sp. CS-041913 TaxID=3239917 RepID=UPI003D8FC5DA
MNGIAKAGHEAAVGETSFVEELRRLRGGMSQRELAKVTHYSPGHHSNVETGVKPPTEDFARACDTALNTGGRLVAIFHRDMLGPRRKGTSRPVNWSPEVGLAN